MAHGTATVANGDGVVGVRRRVDVLLDAPTHSHMEPMAPMARGNPLGGMISRRQVMGWRVGLAVIGRAATLARSYRNRRRGWQRLMHDSSHEQRGCKPR